MFSRHFEIYVSSISKVVGFSTIEIMDLESLPEFHRWGKGLSFVKILLS